MRKLKITNSITNRESQSLEKYLQEINKLKMISPDEEVRLAGLIKKGDKKALENLVTSNLRFVVSVAKQYQYQGLSLPDLVNEGNLGLMKAARSFDVTRGFKFISYAVWWIRQHIMQALAQHARLIRLPINKVALRGQIQRAGSLLEQKLERTASAEELAEALNMGVEEIVSGLGMNERHISLDTQFSENEELTLLDVLENPNAVNPGKEMNYKVSLKMEIDRSLQTLRQREKETLCYFFGIDTDHPLRLEDIATKFSVTTERVRQIKDKAIGKLRACGNLDLLRGYLCA